MKRKIFFVALSVLLMPSLVYFVFLKESEEKYVSFKKRINNVDHTDSVKKKIAQKLISQKKKLHVYAKGKRSLAYFKKKFDLPHPGIKEGEYQHQGGEVRKQYSDEEITFDGNEYYLSDSLSAIAKAKYASEMGEYLYDQYGHSIYRNDDLNINELFSFNPRALPVLLNKKTLRPGILTGKLLVKIQQGIEIKDIIDDYSLSLDSSIERLDLYIFVPTLDQDILVLKNDMEKSKQFVSVRLEIIEGSVNAK